ncbi:alpha-E domain-containing protein [Puia sp. P3]|uniref:alpha-E domain-containing protein n=1 Tax=Puia sp. P3 TaxID=3423952 RepID=UPI003D668F88
MAGGLCRTGSESGSFIISNQSGGISKDTWILSPEPDRTLTALKVPPDRIAETEEEMLPSHAAENLFWVGRYTERVLGNARFLRTVMQFLAEGNKLNTENNQHTEKSLLVALTQYTYTYPGFTGPQSQAKFANPWTELKEVLLNERRNGSLKFNFLQLQRVIHEVREHWSTDTWRVLRTMEEEAGPGHPLSHQGHLRMLHTLDNLITFIVAFIGLNRESISREQGWIVLDIGRKIEQSLLLLSMLKTTLVVRNSDLVDYNLQQSVLMSQESLVNYRYKYRRPIDLRLVLDFLLFDPNNPRSLTYQVDRLNAHRKNLPEARTGHALAEYERIIVEANALLKSSDKDQLTTLTADGNNYHLLDDFLSRMSLLLATIPDVISKTYFKHEVPHFPSNDVHLS